MAAGIGVALFVLGLVLQRFGGAEVGGIITWIGAACAAGGFVCGVSLALGGLSVFALLAAICACFAQSAPADRKTGLWLLAAGFTLAAVDQLPGRTAMWLGTIAIIAGVLGLASLLSAWLRPRRERSAA